MQKTISISRFSVLVLMSDENRFEITVSDGRDDGNFDVCICVNDEEVYIKRHNIIIDAENIDGMIDELVDNLHSVMGIYTENNEYGEFSEETRSDLISIINNMIGNDTPVRVDEKYLSEFMNRLGL